MTDKNKKLSILITGIIIYILIFLYDYDNGQIRFNIMEASLYFNIENFIEHELTRGPDEFIAWIIWLGLSYLYLFNLWTKRSLITSKVFDLISKFIKSV